MGKHEESFERWLRYEREVQLANTAHMTFDTLPELALYANPTITLPRETLLNLRASHVLLTNVVAGWLDSSRADSSMGRKSSWLLRSMRCAPSTPDVTSGARR